MKKIKIKYEAPTIFEVQKEEEIFFEMSELNLLKVKEICVKREGKKTFIIFYRQEKI